MNPVHSPERPSDGMRDRTPPGRYKLGWEYLLDSTPMRRRVTSLDVGLSATGVRVIEVDVSLPDAGRAEPKFGWNRRRWFLPVAFLPKDPVAPSLGVFDGSGAALPVPTKRECMALTMEALEFLAESERAQSPSDLRVRLMRDIVCEDAFRARVSRLVLENREGAPDGQLGTLLEELEDQFLLWVPLHGVPGDEHHLTIRRDEIRRFDQIRRRLRRREVIAVPTAAGEVDVALKAPTGPTVPDLPVALERLLTALALRPIEFRTSDSEARRFASYHLRVQAPAGFVVRSLRVASIEPSPDPNQETLEELQHQPNLAIQGNDSDVAHVHLARRQNPAKLYLRATFGLRGGITTLWMLAAVFGAGLLWLVHHHVSFGPPAEQNKQIAAGVLLLGPAFASAWAVHSDHDEQLRTVVAALRMLLLISAGLAVAAALALAEVFPSGSSRTEAIDAYAAASYFVAVPLVSVWASSSKPTWLVYRYYLHSQRLNLAAIASIAAAGLLVGVHGGLPMRASGAMLFLAGIALSLIAFNPLGEPLGRARTVYRPLAGIGAMASIALAGYFLGFYDRVVDEDLARLACCACSGALLVAALLGLVFGQNANRRWR